MRPKEYGRRARVLAVLLIAGAAYCVALLRIHSFTGHPLVDGVIGVVAGLCLCARPAANAVDLVFAQRGSHRQLTSSWSGLGWLSLNMLTLALGWFIIASGAARLAAHSG
jgi:uncharacterized membrane protein HdeD (DUF308 family)